MRALFTSDWQLELDNIQTCKIVTEEILAIKQKYAIDILVHCGDVKRIYNPVDVRVTNAIIKMIGQFTSAGLPIAVDLGNHDRVGMHVDKQNWFPALRKAGAQAFDEPGKLVVEDTAIYFLPFRQNTVSTERDAADMEHANPEKDILVFHAELQTARYNMGGLRSTTGISLDALKPNRYKYCIGGHFHLQQCVGKNVYYVGSPFVTDWGEVNQPKGYLLYDSDTGRLHPLASSIPGWYDIEAAGFRKPKSWEGTKVRVRVPVGDLKHIHDELQAAEEAAQEKHPGAQIIVIPELQDAKVASSKIKLEYSDRKKLDLYIEETLPDNLKNRREKVLNFLLDMLAQGGGLQLDGGELRFKRFKGRNVLSFIDVDVKLKPGLFVVSGRNEDRGGKSNGSGKTSYLQLPAIAFCGTTFKDQKHDRWRNRWVDSKEQALAEVWFTDAQGRECVVSRTRKPIALKLFIDNKIFESGNRVEDTQKLVEKVTGFNWTTLSNTVYIDQSQAHLMLTGSEVQRKEFLARLQNLERYEKAWKQVRALKAYWSLEYTSSQQRLEGAVQELSGLNETLQTVKSIVAPEGDAGVALESKKLELQEKKKELAALQEHLRQITEQWKEEGEQLEASVDAAKKKIGGYIYQIEQLRLKKEKAQYLKGTCDNCHQPINEKLLHQCEKEWEVELVKLSKKRAELAAATQETVKNIVASIGLLNKVKARVQKALLEVNTLRGEIGTLKEKAAQQQQRKELVANLRSRIEKKKAAIEAEQKKFSGIKKWLRVLKYAESVFARDGLPAYLNAQICPRLNAAAEEYSELFTKKEIQVHFAVDAEGRMDIQVINANGGETIEDQSEGEMKIASLITSFAVREVAPKTNLLILDEPGDGLDSQSAKEFARGLMKVAKKFETILVTSHNPVILSELASANLVEIVKRDGISLVT